MTKRLHNFLILFLVSFLFASSVTLAKDLEISKDFTLFTSENLQGYSKPLWTTIGESFHSNQYTNAQYPEYWTIGLDLSWQQFFIPDDHKVFDAGLPEEYGNTNLTRDAEIRDGVITKEVSGTREQPTIYGGSSHATYSAPQNNTRESQNLKTVAFAEGWDADYMPGLPTLQLMVGFPSATQLRLRFFMAPVQDESLIYFGALVNQRLDHFFNLFQNDSTWALAFNGDFHLMNRTGISINSYSAGLHISKFLGDGFTAYGGLQYEGLSGEFIGVRQDFDPNDVANSPYKEVRDGDNLEFDIESFSSYRILLGIAYRTGFFEPHLDFGFAAQPMINFGFTFHIAEIGKPDKIETIEGYEEFEKIEKVKKSEENEEGR